MASIHDQIKEVVTTHRVVLFMKGTKQFPQCGFSSRAVQILNAAGVMQVPLVMSVWDDEYGISVPKEFHTIKQSISEALKGFVRDKKHKGFELFVANGWDYPTLYDIYQKAAKIAREEHIPVLVHVKELTQPQGHSTSGSHERYKSAERLQWEKEFDCITKMREWILAEKYATEKRFLFGAYGKSTFISDLKRYNLVAKHINNVYVSSLNTYLSK